jgi:hypothetical protein
VTDRLLAFIAPAVLLLASHVSALAPQAQHGDEASVAERQT